MASAGTGCDLPFRQIVETANLGIWALDPEGNTTFANAKMSEILGYPPEEMRALSLFDVLDDQGGAQAAENLALRRQGISAQLECAFLRKDGTRVWVLLNASPLSDGAGRYLGAVSMMSEITDRKKTEEALHRREQQLAEAQRVAHLGSWEWDVAADRTTWSDELYRMFDLDPDNHEPTYEGYLARVHRDDLGLVQGRVGAALQGEDAFECDNRIVRPGGEVVWVHSRGEVIRDESGAPLRMRGTAHDITISKRAEERLEKTTARYRLLQKMASAANEALEITEVLQAAADEICAHTGWPIGHAYLPAEDDSGTLVSSDIWHMDDPEPFAALRTTTATTSTRAGRCVVGSQMSDPKPMWVTEATLDQAGVPRQLGLRTHLVVPVLLARETVAVLEFFSPEVLEPDQELLDTLGQVGTQLSRVVERQRAAAELATARDAAMESSRLKSEFLATMSHEIRTPMNGVIGLTGLLLGTSLDDRQRQYAEGVQSAGDVLLSLINDILDFSKIEAGRLELEMVDFDLVTVVEEAAHLVAEGARRKGLELVAYCYPDLPAAVRGDPARLRQVLLNLTSNAVKFTERGEVVLRTRLVEESEASVVVRFEVSDTGIGIDGVDRHRLFEPFSQADTSTTRRFGGTGLGLAICTQLVAAMGGELGVDSEPGRGSTFWFTLPFGRTAAGAVAPNRPFHHLLEGLRVLVVDDNDTNRLILREQLVTWGMRPNMAADGPSGHERLREAAGWGRPFDLALLDMRMDGMNGLDLARRISAEPELAGTRLVLLTSTADVGLEEAARAGIAACLTKPVRLSQLYDCLMRLTAPPLPARSELPRRPSDPSITFRHHVLVVEDNDTNQMVALGILEGLGYRADVAANGLEALEALARRAYDAVLMDCQMPEMDGYAAAGEIRRREGQSLHTPIIAMTAGAIEGDRERCLAAGMDDYISKPVKREDVAAALVRWMDGVPNEPTGRVTPDPADTAAGPVFDHDRLDMLGGLGPADGSVLARMVDSFLAEAPASMAALAGAVADGDAPALRQGAHLLRGAAANLGAPQLAAICSELEALGRAGNVEKADALLKRLPGVLDSTARALRAAVAPGPRDSSSPTTTSEGGRSAPGRAGSSPERQVLGPSDRQTGSPAE